MMRIRGSVRGKCLRSALQGGRGPVLEALRDWLVGSHNQERNGNQRQQAESLHSFHLGASSGYSDPKQDTYDLLNHGGTKIGAPSSKRRPDPSSSAWG